MNVYFLLSCNKCKWWKKSTGTTEDLKGLVEVKGCANCHYKQRKFKCPKCANVVKMMRVNEETDANIQKKEPGTNS